MILVLMALAGFVVAGSLKWWIEADLSQTGVHVQEFRRNTLPYSCTGRNL